MDYRFLSPEGRAISEKTVKFFSPSLTLFLCSICSSSLAYFFHLGYRSDLVIFSASFMLLCLSIYMLIHLSPSIYRNRLHAAVMLLLCAVSASLPCFTIHENTRPRPMPLTGELEITDLKLSANSLSANCIDEKSGTKVLAWLPEGTEAETGSVIRGNLFLKKQARSSMYSEYLIKKGFSYVLAASKENEIIPPLKHSTDTAVRNYINSLIGSKTDETGGRYLKALIFGNKNHLDQKLLYFSGRSGVLHVFAASGLHVGIVIFLPLLLLGRLSRKTAYFAAALPAAAYLFAAGFPVSLMRATFMFAAAAYSVIRTRSANAFNCLWIAALAITCISPHELYSLGFQLSFAATLSILLFYRKIREFSLNLPFKLSESLSLSFAVQIFILPVVFFSLNETNFNSIAANIIFIPLITFIFTAGIICLVIPESFFIFRFVKQAYSSLCSLVPGFAETFSALPFFFRGKECISFMLMPPLLVLIMFFVRKKHLKFACFITVYAVFISSFMLVHKTTNPPYISISERKMSVHADTGCSLNTDDVLSAYYSSHIREVEIFLDTSDSENTDAVNRLMSRFTVNRLFITGNINYSRETYFLFRRLEKEKIRFEIIKIDKHVRN